MFDIIDTAESFLGDILGGIFGGKDYVSAKIGAFGGGGQRFGKSGTDYGLPADLMVIHYNRVVKILDYENVTNPNESQRSTFWQTWDRELAASSEIYRKAVSSGELEKAIAQISANGSRPPAEKAPFPWTWVIVGIVVLFLFLFLLKKK